MDKFLYVYLFEVQILHHKSVLTKTFFFCLTPFPRI